MTSYERLLHTVAFDAARMVEDVVAIPRKQRARMFFEVFRAIKRGLEEFKANSEQPGSRLSPGNN